MDKQVVFELSGNFTNRQAVALIKHVLKKDFGVANITSCDTREELLQSLLSKEESQSLRTTQANQNAEDSTSVAPAVQPAP